jgi:hypothetical protein
MAACTRADTSIREKTIRKLPKRPPHVDDGAKERVEITKTEEEVIGMRNDSHVWRPAATVATDAAGSASLLPHPPHSSPRNWILPEDALTIFFDCKMLPKAS